MAEELNILHVDMDAFFAAVEQLDNPELRGKPVLVGGAGRRGVLCTASYEARKHGCHSAMPTAIALRKCPDAILLPVRGERYRELSENVFEIFDRFTPLVEPLSIDEAFLDVSGTERLLGPPCRIARDLKECIKAELGLTASVGVAPIKFLAKLASDLEKPDGLTILTTDEYIRRSSSLPLRKIWGLGPASAKRFEEIGVQTIAQLRDLSLSWLERNFGSSGEHFHRLARGLDDRTVTPDHQAKSIGQERTFPIDLEHPEEVLRVLMGEVEQVCRRLRKHGLFARTVTVKIRYGDFKTITRRTTMIEATNSTKPIWEAARDLFNIWAKSSFQPVRLIGATTSDISSTQLQRTLFPDPQEDKLNRLDKAADIIVDRFGESAITHGASLSPPDQGSQRRERSRSH